MFYNALNEQRHLTGVMVGLESCCIVRWLYSANFGAFAATGSS
jgi:hypothetical protein